MNLDEIARLNRVQTEDLRGPQGPPGAGGRDGERGPRGLDGTDGGDGRDGKAGERGLKGDQGDPGRDGFDAEGRVAITATDEPDFLPKKLVAGPNVTIIEEGFGSIRWLRVSATAPVNFGGGGAGPAGAPGATGPPGPAGAGGKLISMVL